jgi:hypothetical protein
MLYSIFMFSKVTRNLIGFWWVLEAVQVATTPKTSHKASVLPTYNSRLPVPVSAQSEA